MFASITEQGPLTRAFVFSDVSTGYGREPSGREIDASGASRLSSGFEVMQVDGSGFSLLLPVASVALCVCFGAGLQSETDPQAIDRVHCGDSQCKVD